MYTHAKIIFFEDGTQVLEDTELAIVDDPRDTHWTIAQGDTLLSIAFEVYRNQDNWDLIAKRNNFIDPYDLVVGTILTIPHK